MLLLPENVRIRKYNLSSEKFSDYLEGEERIQAVDYDWDPEGIGLSKYELWHLSLILIELMELEGVKLWRICFLMSEFRCMHGG